MKEKLTPKAATATPDSPSPTDTPFSLKESQS